MRYLFLGLALGLSACGSSWPPGSSVSISTSADASVMARAMADYLAGAVRPGTPITIVHDGSSDPISVPLNKSLSRAGVVVQEKGGEAVRYVVGPIDGGELLRVSINDTEGMTRTFSRSADGTLVPAGPVMVALP